jgi:hypothetical protein
MTHAQLIRAVAGATGESPRTVARLGFRLAPPRPAADLEPEDLHLALDCVFCGHATALVSGPGGLPPFAECPRCDVAFDYPPGDVYVAPARALTPTVRRTAG